MATITLPDVDKVAAMVHARWLKSKRAEGITSRTSTRDGSEMIVEWSQLSEPVKDENRELVNTVYDAIADASSVL